MQVDFKPSDAKRSLPIPRNVAPATSYTAAYAVVALAVLFPATLYFGFFGAILVDELVLETRYLGRNLPGDVKDVAEFVYAPLFLLVEGVGIDI